MDDVDKWKIGYSAYDDGELADVIAGLKAEEKATRAAYVSQRLNDKEYAKNLGEISTRLCAAVQVRAGRRGAGGRAMMVPDFSGGVN